MRAARNAGYCLAVLLAAGALGSCASFATPKHSQLELPAERLQALEEEARAACVARVGEAGLPAHRFTTDGCSMWPDGDWQACCVAHDQAYWCGGTDAARLAADGALRQCVGAQGSAMNAGLMYWGVRAGGIAGLPVPWRWGYGHDWPTAGQP